MMQPRALQPYLSKVLEIQPKTGQGGGRIAIHQGEILLNDPIFFHKHFPPFHHLLVTPTATTQPLLPGETGKCTSLATPGLKGKSASQVMMNRVQEALLHLIKPQCTTPPPWDSLTGFLKGKLSSTGFPEHRLKLELAHSHPEMKSVTIFSTVCAKCKSQL